MSNEHVPGTTLEGLDAVDPKFLLLMIHFMGLLYKGILFVSSLALLGASLILCSSVFLRYFLKIPTDWQDEMSAFLLVGATFMSAAFVQAQRGHIGIETLAGFLSPPMNKYRLVFCDLVSLLFCAFFSMKCWELLHEAWIDGHTTSSSWAPPLSIPYSFMAVGMSLLSLQILLQLLTNLLRKGKKND